MHAFSFLNVFNNKMQPQMSQNQGFWVSTVRKTKTTIKRKLNSSFIEAISVHPVGYHNIFYETLQSIFEINFYVPRSIIFVFLIDPDVSVSLSIYHHQSFKSVINDDYAK